MSQKRCYTVKEIQEILGISRPAVYALLNKGDIKAVQGDSGHSQTDMVTDVYSHIIDEDRKKNAELFEDAFYKKNNLNPNMVSEEVDMELLMKALANPEMRALLNSLAKTMK